VGNNLRVEIAVNVDDFDFAPALAVAKDLCDHRCFFTDVEGFADKPSTLEAVAWELGRRIFALGGPRAHVLVAESEHLSCLVRPGQADVEISARVLNMELKFTRPINPETSLAFGRDEAWAAVRSVAPDFAEKRPGESENAWGERLFSALQSKVKGLQELLVDVGGHRILRVRPRV
jgi:hypothetical protein